MMRRFLLMAATLPAFAALPGWWRALPSQPALAARFVQQSDSAVFGKLQQKGTLLLARGGRLRVAYESGLLVVSDGQRLVQYDPDTRTAEGIDLKEALKSYPLLGLLLDPRRLDSLYRAEALPGEAVRLHPRRPGLPELQVEGQHGLLGALSWTDPTGARQRLELVDPHVPPPPAPSTFRFVPPAGTRWATSER
jgi:outer membrane lipoprotein-sorting protein